MFCLARKSPAIGFLISLLPMLAAAIVCVQSFAAHAQDKKMMLSDDPYLLILTDQQEDYNLVRHAAIYTDDMGMMKYQDVVRQHLQGRKITQDTDFDHSIHVSDNTSWIVFPILNGSTNEEWEISFGDYWDGRTGIPDEFTIFHPFAGEILFYMNENDVERSLHVSSARLQIPIDGEALIVVKYAPKMGSLANIPFRLSPINAHAVEVPNYLTLENLILVILNFGALFFLSFTRAQNGRSHLLFVAYFALAFLGFTIKQQMVFSDHVWASYFPYVIAALMAFIAPAMTLFYLDLNSHQAFIKRWLHLSSYIPMAALLLAVFYIESGYYFLLVTSLANIVCYIGLVVVSIYFALKRMQIAANLAFGWFFVILGTLISTLAHMNIIDPMPLQVMGAELSLIPLTLALAYCAHMRMESVSNHLRRRLDMHEIEDPILNDLKQSKESANQQRLLRVIERERQTLEKMRLDEQQRSEEMEVAKEEADIANRSKSAFLAMISHEIRTPMNGVMGMVKLLMDTKLSKEQRDYSLTISDSGDAMIALLNDILDFEKIETGKLALEKIDFETSRLIRGVATLMLGHAADKEVSVEFDIDKSVPDYLIGDPTRLRQVLLNLTGNAIKFTESGHVKIIVKASKMDWDENIGMGHDGFSEEYMIYFAVEDTGIGISKEAQRSLFDPFSQADTSIVRRYGGSGLGLAICKGIIERMDSTIHVRSVEDEGSTFYFTIRLPIGMEPKSQEEQNLQTASYTYSTDSPKKGAPVEPLRILVVEDNQINQKVLAGILGKDGHEIIAALSDRDALDEMRSDSFDVILMDLELKGASGLDLTQTIRSLPNSGVANTPIVAMTGHTDDETRQKCFEVGMNEFLTKPIIPETLRDILRQMTELRHEQARAEITAQQNQAEAALDDDVQDDDTRLPNEADKEEPLENPDGYANPSYDPNQYDFDEGYDADLDFDSFEEALEQFDSLAQEALGGDENAARPKSPDIDPEDGVGTLQKDGQTVVYGDEDMLGKFETLADNPFAGFGRDDSDDDKFVIETLDEIDPSQAKQSDKDDGDVFDESMLSTLKDSLGTEEVLSLIDGLFEQSRSILVAMRNHYEAGEMVELRERAHEMKGMAGNFGLKQLAGIVTHLEDHMRKAETPDVTLMKKYVIEDIPAADERARTVLYRWVKK